MPHELLAARRSSTDSRSPSSMIARGDFVLDVEQIHGFPIVRVASRAAGRWRRPRAALRSAAACPAARATRQTVSTPSCRPVACGSPRSLEVEDRAERPDADRAQLRYLLNQRFRRCRHTGNRGPHHSAVLASGSTASRSRGGSPISSVHHAAPEPATTSAPAPTHSARRRVIVSVSTLDESCCRRLGAGSGGSAVDCCLHASSAARTSTAVA